MTTAHSLCITQVIPRFCEGEVFSMKLARHMLPWKQLGADWMLLIYFHDIWFLIFWDFKLIFEFPEHIKLPYFWGLKSFIFSTQCCTKKPEDLVDIHNVGDISLTKAILRKDWGRIVHKNAVYNCPLNILQMYALFQSYFKSMLGPNPSINGPKMIKGGSTMHFPACWAITAMPRTS